MITSSGPEQSDIASELKAILTSVEGSLTLGRIKGRIDRLAVSADAKALLMDIASMTVKVGEWIVAIGRKIVSFALDLIKRFPNTAFGIVIALVLGALAASAFGGIPLVGAVLTTKLQAIMLLFGIAKGAMADMTLTPVRGEVDVFVQDLNPLATAFR